MEYRVTGLEDLDDVPGAAGGRAEVLQPEPEPEYSMLTIEGEIQAFGKIAGAVDDHEDPVRGRYALGLWTLAAFPFVASVVAVIITALF